MYSTKKSSLIYSITHFLIIWSKLQRYTAPQMKRNVFYLIIKNITNKWVIIVRFKSVRIPQLWSCQYMSIALAGVNLQF